MGDMKGYVDFEEIIKEYNLGDEDKNNLIAIILSLHNENKSVCQLAKQLEQHNLKIKYYLDILETEKIVKREKSEEMGITNLQYLLVKSEILGSIDGKSELMRKIQAKRLGGYLEEQILNVGEYDINLISLAEIHIGYDDVQKVRDMINDIYLFLVKKEQEALSDSRLSDEKRLNYSLLTAFVPIGKKQIR